MDRKSWVIAGVSVIAVGALVVLTWLLFLNGRLGVELQTLNEELQSTSSELAQTKDELARTDGELVRTKDELARATAEVSILSSKVTLLDAQKANLEKEKTALQGELRDKDVVILNLRRDLDAISSKYPPKKFGAVQELQFWLSKIPDEPFSVKGVLAIYRKAVEDGYEVCYTFRRGTDGKTYAGLVAILANGDVYAFDCVDDNVFYITSLSWLLR